MMKKILIGLSLFLSLNSMANCNIFIPKKEYLHDSGYSISFDFTSIIGPKNYIEVYSQSEATYRLELEGVERVTPTFHFAMAILRVVSSNGELVTKSQQQTRCYTQLCGISDYGSSFRKAYQELKTKLLSCSLE
jgi:hypothetical protein